MSKMKMQKIELIALLPDSKKIIELLQRRGTVEFCDCREEELFKTGTASIIAEFDKFRTSARQALEILSAVQPEKKSLAEIAAGKREVEKHDFGAQSQKLEKTLHIAAEIIRLNRAVSENRAAAERIRVRLDSLEQWKALDVPLKFRGTSSTSAFIGSLPVPVTESELEAMLPEQCCAEIIFSSKRQTDIFVLCSKQAAEETEKALSDNFFIPISESDGRTASELSEDLKNESAELERKSGECIEQIRTLAEHRIDLEFTVDYLQMRIDKYEALNSLGFSRSVFVLDGYIPQKYAAATVNEIESKYTAAVRIYAPEPDEDVPVLLENSGFSEPLEGVTEMYSLPGKKDPDPTPIMSFFYYLFFGMMLSDAGYGIVMTVGCALALKKLNPEEKLRKMLTMFRNCGISTIIFGALFGSWFGDIVQVVGREFFGREIGSLAIWFEPIDDPIKLLLYSFALGIAHLFLGLAVSFVMKWRDGRRIDAVLDTVPIYMTILGVCPLGASILTTVPESLTKIGGYLAAAGAALLVVTAGRGSGSVFGKLFGGLYALYNTATGYLSDILSYSRLLALGLATGSIAGVINLIGVMPGNKAVKAVLLIVVFIVGHTANIAINLLGAYVHTDRLQFVELFSKFYEGGGREFEPLRVKTNYIKFKEETVK